MNKIKTILRKAAKFLINGSELKEGAKYVTLKSNIL